MATPQVRASGARVLAVWHLLLAGLAALVLILAITVMRKYGFGQRGPALDYVAFWTAGHLSLQGDAGGIYNTAVIGPAQRAVVDMNAPGVFPFFYPPVALLLFAPLALLPYGASFVVFALAQGAALVGALRRLLPAPWPLTTLLGAPAALLTLGIGQNGCLTAALMAAGCGLIERQPALAGAALGCLAIKPHVAVLVPVALAVGRQGRALAAACGTVLALCLASLIFGVRPWLDFLLAAHQARGVVEQFSGDWIKMISPFAALRLAGAGVGVAYAVQAAVACAALGGVWLCRRANGGWLVAALAAATLLISPYLFDYDLPMSLVPLAVVCDVAMRRGWLPGEKIVCGAVFLAPLAARLVAQGMHVGVMPVVGLALLGIVVRRGRQEVLF